jgi:undecaprenyl diphosphate synthase
MDGNGRWAKRRGLPRAAGHRAGVKAIKRTVEAAHELGISYLTLYAFSAENWSRPAEEVAGLMQLILETLRTELADLERQNIRLNLIGRWRELDPAIVTEIDQALDKTRGNTAGTLTLALNYSGRGEIVDAARALAQAAVDGTIQPSEIDETSLEERLDSAGLPAPDLLIRTSGEMRVSNFLLWEIAYSEFWVTDDFWPDFGAAQLERAVAEFQQRRRRFGGLSEGD